MTIGLDPKQVVTFEELLMSQVIQQEALTRLLIEKRILSKEELLEKVRAESGRGIHLLYMRENLAFGKLTDGGAE